MSFGSVSDAAIQKGIRAGSAAVAACGCVATYVVAGNHNQRIPLVVVMVMSIVINVVLRFVIWREGKAGALL